MTTQESSIGSDDISAGPAQGLNSPASLVEIAGQLSDGQPVRPEVVFVESDIAADAFVAQSTSQLGGSESGYRYEIPIATKDSESPQDAETMVSIDPFSQEVGGEVPAMPTLPVINAQDLTDKVVARESEGEHHAWRLLADQKAGDGEAVEQCSQDSSSTESNQAASESIVHEQADGLREPNFCGEGEDCFFAYPGEVISIDGNQGFDHIDMRSYSIEDATFQPGAIVLHAGTDPTHAAEGECVAAPITIRHRGIAFAIFSGEVRVDL